MRGTSAVTVGLIVVLNWPVAVASVSWSVKDP